MTTHRDDMGRRRAAVASRGFHAAACLGLAVLAAGCSPGDSGNRGEEREGGQSLPTGTVVQFPLPGGTRGFVKSRAPVFEGQSGVAGDPTLLIAGGDYRMFYTCATDMKAGLKTALTGEAAFRCAICRCRSTDGMSWQVPRDEGQVPGLVLRGRPGRWDENIETCSAFQVGGETILLYVGYRDEGHPARGFPSALGAARSADGERFERVADDAILRPTPRSHDNDGIYSPFVIEHGGGLSMIYVGHCYTQCNDRAGLFLLGATSPDGLTWTKREGVVLEPSPDIPWMTEGVAEPAVVAGPDGLYYLFFTGVTRDSRVLGLARGASPFGPFEVQRTPILTPTAGSWDEGAVLAPFVRIEGERVRMWYMGTDHKEKPGVGYAEARWPLWAP